MEQYTMDLDSDPRIIREDVPLERGQSFHVVGRMQGLRLNIDVYSTPRESTREEGEFVHRTEITRDSARQLRNILDRFISDVSYGGWSILDDGESGAGSLAFAVGMHVGNRYADYDSAGLISAYEQAIQKALPPGFTLERGREFFGPLKGDRDKNIDRIKSAVRRVDFWAIAEQFRVG